MQLANLQKDQELDPRRSSAIQRGQDSLKADQNGAKVKQASILTDFEAIANKELAPADEELIEIGCQHWEIQDWPALSHRTQSPVFEVGGHRWNLLLFPRGNNETDHASIYLEFAGAKNGDSDDYACAQFIICLSKPSDPTSYSVHSSYHRFDASESDWGFNKFVSNRKMNNNNHDGFMENDKVRITTVIRVYKDQTGVLWHNFQNYDSKKMTGYVGLKNQGATCYMNSLFQSLYCTNYFRKAVYQIPTENDEPTQSVALALQRVFYNLQFHTSSVGTTELTRSFGWDSLDAFMQHDVQEFNRVLQDNLEAKMKNTPADGAIKKLFVGKMKSYIKCINVDYESSRSEDYYDIQLNVKGCKNLEESFKDYIEVETMEGDNKYQAEGHGLQDAKKGVIFESFPPVLHLQLKRFEYDIMRDTMVKINDRHEFPLSLDLEPYLDESADKSISHEYVLHGVLVHSGDLSGGHYFAFVKPDANGKWLKFDDDRVVPSALKEVLEENFGGEPANSLNTRNNGRTFKRYTNAYMLVYIRKAMLGEILAEMTEKDIPQHLVKSLEEEHRLREQRRQDKEQQHLFMPALIVTDESFSKHHGLDFVDFSSDCTKLDEACYRKLRVRRNQVYGQFKQDLAAELGLPSSHVRCWLLAKRKNYTIRPDFPITDEDLDRTLEEIHLGHSLGRETLQLYLETAHPTVSYNQLPFPPPPSKFTTRILVFIKLFDPITQDIRGIGKIYASKVARVGSIMEDLNIMAGFEPGTELVFYEEIKPEMIELMECDKSFYASEIQDGDIICIQQGMTEKMIQDIQDRQLHATVADYMDYLYQKRLVRFYPAESNPEMEFDLILRTTMTYSEVAAMVADRLGADSKKILLHISGNKIDDKFVRRYQNSTLLDIENSPYNTDPQICRLFYEVLDISLAELEKNRLIKITWLLPTHSVGTYDEFYLPKQSKISDILQHLEQHGTKLKSKHGSQKVRVYEADNHRFHRELAMDDLVTDISSVTQLYAEEIPREELRAQGDGLFISVFHYHHYTNRVHSAPFKFLIIKNEPFEQTKSRLQQRTGMNDKDWAKVKISIVSKYTTNLIDDDEYQLSDYDFLFDDLLGLDHPDKSGKANGNGNERGLTIRG